MDNKLLVKEFYEKIVSNNLIDKVENYIAVDCALRIGENSTSVGLEGMKQHVIDIRKTYPDLKIRIIHQYADRNYVISEIITEGTHFGE